ncbi:MAG: hypothetical protein JXA69_05220 [Phycisphaerae bacterium]|nr:hypothetical protein [Phycisphaerae bacterium]
MMKRALLSLLIVALLSGQTCTTSPETAPTDSVTGYRKVTLTGTISTDINDAMIHLEPGEGLTAIEYAGEFSIELWFPANGGTAIQQRCTVALVEGGYTAEYYGDPAQCVFTPLEGAYTPRPFELEATLTVDGIYLNDLPADELTIHLAQPISDVIQVHTECGGAPAIIPDPAAYSTLSLYWYDNTWVLPMRLNVQRNTTVEDWPLVAPYETSLLNATQTGIEVLVDSLE